MFSYIYIADNLKNSKTFIAVDDSKIVPLTKNDYNKKYKILTKDKKDKESLNSDDEHKMFKINKSKQIDEIETSIENIDSLIEIGKLSTKNDFKSKNYTINVSGIYQMNESLEYLKDMVGLKNIKSRLNFTSVWLHL